MSLDGKGNFQVEDFNAILDLGPARVFGSGDGAKVRQVALNGRFKIKIDGLQKVFLGLGNILALAGDIQVKAQGGIALLFLKNGV
jgi:hypothetical protein